MLAETVDTAKDGLSTAQTPAAGGGTGGGGAAMAGNVFLGGIIGAGIDAGTGAMYEHKPNPLMVTLEKLEASMKQRQPTTSETLRADGPRTTTERLFNSRDERTTGAAASFQSRQQLLLPTLDKVKARAPDTGSAFFSATR